MRSIGESAVRRIKQGDDVIASFHKYSKELENGAMKLVLEKIKNESGNPIYPTLDPTFEEEWDKYFRTAIKPRIG